MRFTHLVAEILYTGRGKMIGGTCTRARLTVQNISSMLAETVVWRLAYMRPLQHYNNAEARRVQV